MEEYNDWCLEDIAKAAKLLKRPPTPVEFNDEYEMRKVYSMIYDVFRCKYVHNYAFMLHSQLISIELFLLFSFRYFINEFKVLKAFYLINFLLK